MAKLVECYIIPKTSYVVGEIRLENDNTYTSIGRFRRDSCVIYKIPTIEQARTYLKSVSKYNRRTNL